MKLDLVISAPAPGFGPLEWQGGRGVASVHLRNLTGLFVAVTNDSGIIVEIVPPWTWRDLWLEGLTYAYLLFADAGYGTMATPVGLVGAGLYAGGTAVQIRNWQSTFNV